MGVPFWNLNGYRQLHFKAGQKPAGSKHVRLWRFPQRSAARSRRGFGPHPVEPARWRRAIAAKVDPLRPGLVVELGAGSGAVTQALLARGIAPERLIAIEYSDYFSGLLTRRFPGVTVICGDAFDFDRHMPMGEPIAAIVSGLPLLNFFRCATAAP